jgi:peptide/nickel transport system substrate-binding protein
VLGLVFRGLGRPGGPNGEPVPDLAESWTSPAPVDVSGTRLYRLTVTLRAGVRFHNGAPLTPEDVRFTFQLLRELNTPWQGRAQRIRDITLQGQQVTFLMESPDALSPLWSLGIVPQLAYESDPAGFGLRPVGCGPYQVKRIGPEKLELHAFRGFFRGAPRLERLTVVRVPDLDRLGERVEQQELPVAVLPYDEAWYERLRDLGQWQVTPVPANTPTLLHVQTPGLLERDPTRPDIHWNAHLWYLQE